MRKIAIVLTAGIVALGIVVPAGAAPGRTRRASHPQEAPNGATPATSVPDTTSPALALSGLKVAFSSDATNLVRNDRNGVADVFVRDLEKGSIRRVSTNAGGDAANGASYSPALSVDAEFVAFVSEATNLVPNDTNGMADVFLKDLDTGRVKRVSLSSSGAQADGDSNTPFVSLFGDYVTFDSAATNLARNDLNGLPDAFLREVKRGRTSRLAPPPVANRDPEAIEWGQAPKIPRVFAGGEEIPTWWIPQLPDDYWPEEKPFDEPELDLLMWTTRASISYDGRFVTFERDATTTHPSRPDIADVFVIDRVAGDRYRVPAPSWGGHTKSFNRNPIISADGRRVALESWVVTTKKDVRAENPFDFQDVLVWDQGSHSFGGPSTNNFGQMANGHSFSPSISAGGDAVAFVSEATNLVAGDTNGVADVFVKDSRTQTISRASIGPDGLEANGASARPQISYEGRNVVFASDATNLIDDAASHDLYLHDRELGLVPNAAPVFRKPATDMTSLTVTAQSAEGRVGMLEEVSFRLRARDADGDRIRFASLLPMPATATFDGATGAFRWRPTPDEEAARLASDEDEDPGPITRIFAFSVEDPAGLRDLYVVIITVRDTDETVECALVPCGS